MIRWRSHVLPSEADDAAAWWSARRRLGLLSPQEEKAFASWLQDPAHEFAWQRTDEPVAAIIDIAALPEIRRMRDEALAAPCRTSHAWLRRSLFGSIAASLAAGLLWFAQPIGPSSAPASMQAAERYATRVGERREVNLPDGSKVMLDTASVLEVLYHTNRRDIRLLKGQALFKVAKDADRPFVVAAGDRRIVATGTTFDVRVGEDGGVTVVLVEGHVVVEPTQRKGLAGLIPGVGREALEPGQQLYVPATGRSAEDLKIVTTDVVEATSWKRGQAIFRDDPLSAAVDEMNRYSTTKLMIADDRVRQLRISGVFGVERSDNFVAALTAFYPIEAEQRAPGIIILKWQEEAKRRR